MKINDHLHEVNHSTPIRTHEPYSKSARNVALAIIIGALALVLYAYSGHVQAEPRLTLGVGTHHFDQGEHREDNWFMGGQVGPAFAATFQNSVDRRSFAAGLTASHSLGPFEVGGYA